MAKLGTFIEGWRGSVKETVAPAQVVLAYDFTVMATAARTMMGDYFVKLAPDVDAQFDEWSFAELEHARFAEEALEMAAGCDLMVIATTGADGLSTAFEGWFESWLLTRKPIETAVVLIVAMGNEGRVALRLPFGGLEHSNGLRFFARSIKLPETDPLDLTRSVLAQLKGLSLESLPEESGLND